MSIIELDRFYGRKSVLDLLKRRVLDLRDGYRQNIAFVGLRHTGKTMMLERFIADLDAPDIITIYVDLENADLHHVFYKFAGSILFHFARNKGLPLNDDLNLLLKTTETHLPQTTKAIRKIQSALSHGKEREAYLDTIVLPQIFTQETNTFCVLFLDEFQDLEELGIPEVFQDLGKGIMTQRRCLYVVTSSLPWVANRILSEKLSLLFGNFEIIEVQALDLKTSREFISVHLDKVRLNESLTNFLIDFTGGHPLYLGLICRELATLSAVHKQTEIFAPLLAQAIEDILFNRWGVLNRHFELLMERISSGKGNLVVSGLVMTLAKGRQKIQELAGDVQMKQNISAQKVNRLVEMGIVAKNGNYYYLPDKLFKYWIKYVFQKRRCAIVLAAERQKREFQEELADGVERFRAVSQKDFSVRVMELLSCFENESLLINGRRYKLPLFSQMTTSKVCGVRGECVDVIRAATNDGEWVIVLKSGAVGENEISDVLAETKKITQKPQRSVLISLTTLDENTRLRALQERMWIWNEGELTALLNLYDKPFIMQTKEL